MSRSGYQGPPRRRLLLRHAPATRAPRGRLLLRHAPATRAPLADGYCYVTLRLPGPPSPTVTITSRSGYQGPSPRRRRLLLRHSGYLLGEAAGGERGGAHAHATRHQCGHVPRHGVLVRCDVHQLQHPLHARPVHALEGVESRQ
eukprot:293947-Prorocentrum_minimum.AAC.2